MSDYSTYVGIDIGGTKIHAARYTDKGYLVSDFRIETKGSFGKGDVMTRIHHALNRVCDESVASIGVSWAGFVDGDRGIVTHSPHIEGLEGFPLVSNIQQAFHLPVVLENDARLFTFAHVSQLKNKKSTIVGIPIGTGVGVGVWDGDRFLKGSQSFAGELGHMVLNESGHTLEDFLSGQSLSQRFFDAFGEGSLPIITSWLPEQYTEMRRVLKPVFKAFAQSLYTICLAYNPEKIIIGGSVGIHLLSHFEEDIRLFCSEYEKNIPVHILGGLLFSDIKHPSTFGAALWGQCSSDEDFCVR